MSAQETTRQLLLSYIGLLAEKHAYRPGDGFEYKLWDDLADHYDAPTLVSPAERDELVTPMLHTHCWVTYDLEAGTWQLIDIDEWKRLLEKRGH
jgi:hypothetical protein